MPTEIAVLSNPASGRGMSRQISEVVRGRLVGAGIQVRMLRGRDADESLALTRRAVEDGVDAVVAVGGDGLIHLAVQALAGTATRLGVVPAGTGNDVARALNIPRDDPTAAAELVVAGRERTIDLVRSGSKYFVTVLAAGFDAIVNERANAMSWPKGPMKYNLATLAELRTFTPLSYVLDVDGETHRFEAMMVAVGNGPSFGGGMRITEGAVIDDGLIDVVAILPMSRLELIRTFPKVFAGTHVDHPKYRHYRGRSVTIAAPGIVAYADGERFAPLPLTVEVVPGALRVMTP